MRTFLVTGGCGFIGSNYIRFLLDSYSDVKVIDMDLLTYAGNTGNLGEHFYDSRHIFVKGDISDKKAVTEIFQSYKIDAVVNFAAESHVDRSIENPSLFERTNVSGTLCLLDCAVKSWKNGLGKFVHISTDEVYGQTGQSDFPDENAPLRPSSPYAASKAAADMFVLSYARTYKLTTAIVRSSNNYGENQYCEKFIPSVFYRAAKRENVLLYGDGRQKRDWLYVHDNCRAIDLVLNYGEGIYNVPGNYECQNIYLAEKIIDYVCSNVNPDANASLLTHIKDRAGHDVRYKMNGEKLALLGFAHKTDFEQGLNKTLMSYRIRIADKEI